VIARVKWKS